MVALEKCIKSETAQMKNYKRRTRIRDDIGFNFPINHDCRGLLFAWFFYFNVGLKLMYVLYGRNSFILFCFFKKFIKISYSIILHHLDDKIADGIELKELGRIKSTGASGAKFVSEFILFFNIVISAGISIYIDKITEGEDRDYFIYLQK